MLRTFNRSILAVNATPNVFSWSQVDALLQNCIVCFDDFFCSSFVLAQAPKKDGKKFQYHTGEIAIPEATADEPIRKEFSLQQAEQYLEQGAAMPGRSSGSV